MAAGGLAGYPVMAYLEFDAIISSAPARRILDSVTLIRRISAGARIVLVAVRHRGDAFATAKFIMGFRKPDAPFWKRELGIAGDLEAARWVIANSVDAVAATNWAISGARVDEDQ